MRAKGTIVTLPDKEPSGFLVDEAKRLQQQRRERKIVSGAKPPSPPPNWKCYPMIFVVGKNIDEHGSCKGGRLPRCRKCQGNLPPREHHVCPGFQPMFPTTDPEERRAQWEARREMIREAKRNGTFFSEDEDDLSGYEDEPEEDWCDEDDGDPMWE
jgi:hypothetical protein